MSKRPGSKILQYSFLVLSQLGGELSPRIMFRQASLAHQRVFLLGTSAYLLGMKNVHVQ